MNGSQPSVEAQITPVHVEADLVAHPESGQKFIMLSIFTVVGGPFRFFYDPESALTMAKGIEKLAREGLSGLIVP